jgi:hypothetical protein
VRSAGGALSAVQDLSAAGQHGREPHVGVDPDGNAHFAWRRSDGTNFRAQMRRRAADGKLGLTVNLSSAGGNAFGPLVAVAPNGVAHFIWRRDDGSSASCCRILQTRRLVGTSVDAVQDLSAAGQDAVFPEVAVDPNDNATFVWQRSAVIQTRRRDSTGAFGATVNVSN